MRASGLGAILSLVLCLPVGSASAANCIVTTPIGTGDDRGTAAFPELLRIYHLFGDPALSIR